MSQGLGTDIIEIGRIEKIIGRYGQKVLDRLFTKEEQAYCLQHRKSSQHFAGRFAAKEAIVKALGTGIKAGINWLDIEITNDEQGKPVVKLSPPLNQKFNHPQLLISISHSKEYATAVAILT